MPFAKRSGKDRNLSCATWGRFWCRVTDKAYAYGPALRPEHLVIATSGRWRDCTGRDGEKRQAEAKSAEPTNYIHRVLCSIALFFRCRERHFWNRSKYDRCQEVTATASDVVACGAISKRENWGHVSPLVTPRLTCTTCLRPDHNGWQVYLLFSDECRKQCFTCPPISTKNWG